MIRIQSFNEYNLTVGNTQFTFLDYSIFHRPELDKQSAVLHTHQWYELFYVKNGEIEIETQNGVEVLAEGDIAIVPSGLLHCVHVELPASSMGILFTMQAVNKESEKKYVQQFRQLLDKDNIIIMRKFDDFGCFKRLMIYQSYHYEDSDQLVLACLHEIIFLLKNTLLNTGETVLPKMTLENSNYRDCIIEGYINTKFCDSPSLEELARIVHVSIPQLQRIIKRNYHQSFRERVLYLKLQNAKKLLTETELTVGEIAGKVGYTSVYSFFIVFKKYFAMTPNQYRKKFLKKTVETGHAL